MRVWSICVTGVLAASLGGCGPSELSVTMYPENNSGEAGLATLREVGGGVRVTLQLQPTSDTGEQPAHVHSGRCGEIGAVATLGAGGTSGALTPLKEGKSETLLERIRLSDLTGGRYAINVHYSQDGTLYVACGNIP